MYSRKHYLANKKLAKKIILECVERYSHLYNVRYNRISIRNQKTRWGSCSKNKNLNFNYKIIMLPLKQMEYIVVHEICHLIEFNHSTKFWNEVARTFPDYKELRGVLRKTRL